MKFGYFLLNIGFPIYFAIPPLTFTAHDAQHSPYTLNVVVGLTDLRNVDTKISGNKIIISYQNYLYNYINFHILVPHEVELSLVSMSVFGSKDFFDIVLDIGVRGP